MTRSRVRAVAAFGAMLAALGAAGCGDGDALATDAGGVTDRGMVADNGAGTDSGALASEVTIRFAAKVGDAPFRCGARASRCWCTAFPALDPLPADVGRHCLCERCLRSALDAVARHATVRDTATPDATA